MDAVTVSVIPTYEDFRFCREREDIFSVLLPRGREGKFRGALHVLLPGLYFFFLPFISFVAVYFLRDEVLTTD